MCNGEWNPLGFICPVIHVQFSLHNRLPLVTMQVSMCLTHNHIINQIIDETKFPHIQKGMWYIQFISIAYIVLMHISISISYTKILKILMNGPGMGNIPDSKVHGANMGPSWVLSNQDGPHVGPMNLAIRDVIVLIFKFCFGIISFF